VVHVLEADAVPEVLDGVHALLAALWQDAAHVDEPRRARFGTAVAELVANVVEHGGGAPGTPPRLALTLTADGSVLRAQLVDDGAAVPDAAAPEGEVDVLAESGRGLLLVHLVADVVGYERRDGANRWDLLVRT
jgi:serine/threonine-protein kinase RsbW